jgi:hypothetical protein
MVGKQASGFIKILQPFNDSLLVSLKGVYINISGALQLT